jgi:uncharacterized protein involved in outer membrane biogenesis
MILSRLLATAVLTLLLLIAGAAGYLLIADLSHLKRPFLELISDLLDRELIVEGAFELDLGQQLRVSGVGVRLANAEWSQRGDMLTSAELSLEIETLSLLPGRQLIVNRVEARGVSVILEHDVDDRSNWRFGSGSTAEATVPVLRHVNVDDLDVLFDTPSRDAPLRAHIESVALAESASSLLELTAQGEAEGYAFTVAGELGPLAALVAGRDIDAQLSGSIGELQFSARGEVGDVASLGSVTGRLHVAGPDASVIAVLVGEQGALQGPFSVDATIAQEPSGLAFRVHADFTDLDLEADGRLHDPLSLDAWNANIHLQGDHLTQLGRLVGRDNWPEESYALTAALSRSGRQLDIDNARLEVGDASLLLDAHLPEFPDPAGAAATIHLSGANLARISAPFGLPGTITSPFSLITELSTGPEGYDIVSADLTVGNHRLHAEGRVQGYPDFVGTRLNIELSGAELAELTQRYSLPGITGGPYTVRGSVQRTSDGFELDSMSLDTTNLALSLTGHVVARADLLGTRVHVQVAVPDLTAIEPPLRIPLPAKDLTAAGDLHVDVDLLRLDGIHGRLGDVDFTLNGDIDRAQSRLVLRETVLRIDDATIRLDGSLRMEDGHPVTELAVVASGLRLSTLGAPVGWDLPTLPFTATADIRQSAARVEVDNGNVTLGRSSFRATGFYDPTKKVQVGVEIDAKFIDLHPFFNAVDTEPQSKPKPRQERVIPDTPISLEWLPDLYWHVNLRAEELSAFAVPMQNLVLDLDVGPDRLWLTPFQFEQQLGDLSGELKLDHLGSKVRVAADLVARNVPLSFLAAPDQDPTTLPLATVELKAIGTGESGRTLAQDLDGRLRFVTGEGQIAHAAAQSMFGDFFMDLLGALNPVSRRARYAELVCGVVLIDIGDGRIKTRPGIAIQTDRLNVLAQGSVDLETERININFQTLPRRGVGIGAGDLINPFIRVGGTLAHPRLTINRTGSAISGGAALATGGLSLLFQAASRRIRRSDDPCGALLEAEARTAGDEK